MAGTDAIMPQVYPGFSLHDELMLLVRAGLSPMEALQAATLNPARVLGLEDILGTVEKGKLSDLVLLDGNPLADITNTTKIKPSLQTADFLTGPLSTRFFAPSNRWLKSNLCYSR